MFMRTIHEWLCSEETGLPFSKCLCCKVPLIEIDAPWLVNKEMVDGECVLEYAICQPCRDATTAQLPSESKKIVREFLKNEIDWEERLQEFMMFHSLTDRFEKCIVCSTPKDDSSGFVISALFDSGGAVVVGSLPLLMCLPCVSRITDSLCDESREMWRNFLSKHFDGPPNDSSFPGLF